MLFPHSFVQHFQKKAGKSHVQTGSGISTHSSVFNDEVYWK